MSNYFLRRISVAPMMDWTDRHCRYFHRLIAPDVFLYTEMVTAPAIIHGDHERLLGFSIAEKPLALQLGGSDTEQLARCAAVGAQRGYDEINLNCGCPSDRVQSGRFGACLMAEPQTVAACVAAMQREVAIPITVKSRIGIDDHDDYDFLKRFVETVAGAGCHHFIIHARTAILKGLSPRENREVPPLKYDYAYRIKQEFPELHITVNGGIQTVAAVHEHLQHVDGVMIGRAAYHNPWFLNELQSEVLNKIPLSLSAFAQEGERLGEGAIVFQESKNRKCEKPPSSGPSGHLLPTGRREIVEAMLPYISEQLGRGVKLSSITRHMLGLFQGVRGARAWRRILTEQANQPRVGADLVLMALQAIAHD